MTTIRSSDGTSIAYDRYGQGDPIVLVGGALQYRAIDQPTATLAKILANHFTVLHYDRRGRGESGDTMPYSIQREVEDLAAVVDLAGGEAYVFGMSSGAVLALDAAAAGVAIHRLALFEPPFVVDDSRPPVPADYSARLGEFLSAGRHGDAVALFMMEAAEVPDEVVKSMRADAFWPALEAAAQSLRYDAAVMGTTMSGMPLPTGRWRNVDIPVLVMTGSDSSRGQHTVGSALAAILAEATTSTLEGQTHQVDPTILAPTLIEFFRRDTHE